MWKLIKPRETQTANFLRTYQNRLSADETTEASSYIGNVMNNGTWAWLARDTHLQIVSVQDGETISKFEFGEITEFNGCAIDCVEEILIDRPYQLLLAVVLKHKIVVDGIRTSLVLYSIDRGLIISRLNLKWNVTCIRYMNPTNYPYTVINDFDGCIAAGTKEDAILLLDIKLKKILIEVCNERTPEDGIKLKCKIYSENFPDYDQRCSIENKNICYGILVKGLDPSNSVNCLLPINITLTLAIGLNNGLLVLYDLVRRQVVRISTSSDKKISSLVTMEFIELRNNPHPCLYICGIYKREQHLETEIYVINYEHRKYEANEDHYYFENYIDYSVCLNMQIVGHGSKFITCQSITSTKKQLSLFVFSWYSYFERKTEILIFDLNQWYRDKAPKSLDINKAPNCVAGFVYNRENAALKIFFNIKSISYFKAIDQREQYKYPIALCFDCFLLLCNKTLKFHRMSEQEIVLSELENNGSKGFLQPELLYKEVVRLGLMPQWYNSNAINSNSLKDICEALLSVALEHNRFGFLRSCVRTWTQGNFIGGNVSLCSLTIDALRNWILQRIMDLKKCWNGLCNGLFETESFPIDVYKNNQLSFLTHQMNFLCELLQNILTNGKFIAEKAITALQSNVHSLQWTIQYQKTLLWLLEIGILPESRSSLMNASTKFLYPYENLKCFYAGKRKYFAEINKKFICEKTGTCKLIFIDTFISKECENAKLFDKWKAENGDGLYPPPSIEALLQIFLKSGINYNNKCALFLYFILDLAEEIDETKQKMKLMGFPNILNLDPGLVETVKAFWNLDRRNFNTAAQKYTTSCDMKQEHPQWMTKLIIQALSIQGFSKLCMPILRKSTESVPQILKLKVLFLNGLYAESLQIARLSRTSELMECFVKCCLASEKYDLMRKLLYNNKEEEIVRRILKEDNNPKSEIFHIIYLLDKSKYNEAVALMDEISKSGSSVETSNLLLSAYSAKMSPITQGLANIYVQIKDNSQLKENKNEPPSSVSSQLARGNDSYIVGGMNNYSLISSNLVKNYLIDRSDHPIDPEWINDLPTSHKRPEKRAHDSDEIENGRQNAVKRSCLLNGIEVGHSYKSLEINAIVRKVEQLNSFLLEPLEKVHSLHKIFKKSPPVTVDGSKLNISDSTAADIRKYTSEAKEMARNIQRSNLTTTDYSKSKIYDAISDVQRQFKAANNISAKIEKCSSATAQISQSKLEISKNEQLLTKENSRRRKIARTVSVESSTSNTSLKTPSEKDLNTSFESETDFALENLKKIDFPLIPAPRDKLDTYREMTSSMYLSTKQNSETNVSRTENHDNIPTTSKNIMPCQTVQKEENVCVLRTVNKEQDNGSFELSCVEFPTHEMERRSPIDINEENLIIVKMDEKTNQITKETDDLHDKINEELNNQIENEVVIPDEIMEVEIDNQIAKQTYDLYDNIDSELNNPIENETDHSNSTCKDFYNLYTESDEEDSDENVNIVLNEKDVEEERIEIENIVLEIEDTSSESLQIIQDEKRQLTTFENIIPQFDISSSSSEILKEKESIVLDDDNSSGSCVALENNTLLVLKENFTSTENTSDIFVKSNENELSQNEENSYLDVQQESFDTESESKTETETETELTENEVESVEGERNDDKSSGTEITDLDIQQKSIDFCESSKENTSSDLFDSSLESVEKNKNDRSQNVENFYLDVQQESSDTDSKSVTEVNKYDIVLMDTGTNDDETSDSEIFSTNVQQNISGSTESTKENTNSEPVNKNEMESVERKKNNDEPQNVESSGLDTQHIISGFTESAKENINFLLIDSEPVTELYSNENYIQSMENKINDDKSPDVEISGPNVQQNTSRSIESPKENTNSVLTDSEPVTELYANENYMKSMEKEINDDKPPDVGILSPNVQQNTSGSIESPQKNTNSVLIDSEPAAELNANENEIKSIKTEKNDDKSEDAEISGLDRQENVFGYTESPRENSNSEFIKTQPVSDVIKIETDDGKSPAAEILDIQQKRFNTRKYPRKNTNSDLIKGELEMEKEKEITFIKTLEIKNEPRTPDKKMKKNSSKRSPTVLKEPDPEPFGTLENNSQNMKPQRRSKRINSEPTSTAILGDSLSMENKLNSKRMKKSTIELNKISDDDLERSVSENRNKQILRPRSTSLDTPSTRTRSKTNLDAVSNDDLSNTLLISEKETFDELDNPSTSKKVLKKRKILPTVVESEEESLLEKLAPKTRNRSKSLDERNKKDDEKKNKMRIRSPSANLDSDANEISNSLLSAKKEISDELDNKPSTSKKMLKRNIQLPAILEVENESPLEKLTSELRYRSKSVDEINKKLDENKNKIKKRRASIKSNNGNEWPLLVKRNTSITLERRIITRNLAKIYEEPTEMDLIAIPENDEETSANATPKKRSRGKK